jgi:hypothetical protein
MGRVTTALQDDPDCAHIDYDSVITVKLIDPDDELESVTEMACLRGANRAMIGGECIGFINADLTATGTYELSGLLRGLRDTKQFATTHQIGDPFVLLNEHINFLELPLSAKNSARKYKLVPDGGTVADYPAYDHQIVHPTLRHFTPANAYAVRNSTNDDILVRWSRRSRSTARVLGGAILPLYDEIERYKLELWNTGESILRSTHIVDDATEFNVTEAIQSAGFLSLGAPLHIRLYHVSSLVGDSYVLRTTV